MEDGSMMAQKPSLSGPPSVVKAKEGNCFLGCSDDHQRLVATVQSLTLLS